MSEFGEPVSYQIALYRELREAARDFFSGLWHDLPVQVRINPLLVGSTGTGKTFLVRRLADELNLPLFTATAGDWVLLCATARGAPPTLPRLYKFVEDSPQGGILFLDEFEKLGQGGEAGTTDWRKFCQLEIFSVLDRRIIDGVLQDDLGPRFSLTAEKLGSQFRQSILVICAGAWQSLWDSAEPIGFATSPDETRPPSHGDLALKLRLELLNRCSAPLLLRPMITKDYESVFEEILTNLPKNLQAAMQRPTKEEVQEAVRSKKGFRFFEERLALAVRAMRLAQEPRTLAGEEAFENVDRVLEQPCIQFPPEPGSF
jgi:hypothetical protein